MCDRPEIFVSYSSRDAEKVSEIVDILKEKDYSIWQDRERIHGGQNYGPEIVRAIKDAKVLMVMCSNSSVRSKNVKQEIQLAWKYDLSYLPLILEPIAYTEQIEYWLEGWQWIEILDQPPSIWLPGVEISLKALLEGRPFFTGPKDPLKALSHLRQVASYTDQIWPIPAEASSRGLATRALRDLGAPQEGAMHSFSLGSRVRIAIETEDPCHLLLLDQGTSGNIYCLCPSHFAPSTRLERGRNILPQKGSFYDSFVVTGNRGREHLLAILTKEPLELDWMPKSPGLPARILTPEDIMLLEKTLKGLDPGSWLALSTWFDIV